MLVTEEIGKTPLADLIKQVQAGDEVLLTQDSQPVARIVSASQKNISAGATLKIRSIEGHRVLTPNISHEELADEMFGQK